jgi:hypothetical protein
MKHSILLIILLAVIAFGQGQPKRIGMVEFFGYAGIDLDKVKGALPFREGEEFNIEKIEKIEEKKRQAREAVERITGHPPTDVAINCCDNQGNLIIYIGLGGKPISYNTRPKEIAQLPGNGITLYDRFGKAVQEAALKGAPAEDRSKGYALNEYPPLRAIQLEMRAYAVNHETGLRAVLKTSRDDRQRAAATHLLGYARQSESQIAALVYASRDSNDEVRNNAIRALLVLAESNQKTATEIPADKFIEFLLSGTWSDINKAGGLLSILTRGRSPDILAKLRRREVLERLIEVARWRNWGHAYTARFILGRIAGIDEDRLNQLATAGDVDVIIKGVYGR